MKLIVNFDLMEKIKEAQNGYSLKKNIKDTIFSNVQILVFSIPIAAMIPLENDNLFSGILLGNGIYLTTKLIATSIVNTKFKDTIQYMAALELSNLSLDLNNLNVSTSFELLLNTELYDTDYKFSLVKNKVPNIIQQKYYEVPIYDDGKIDSVSIEQEHILGTKKYVLSLGSPKKSFSLKPALSSI